MSSDRDRKLELALKHELRAAGTPGRDACVDAETLGAWADGGLDAKQMASVELHVATCARCLAIVGATARSAPVSTVTESPAGFSLWKWWLAPIAAGAAAVTLWMVVPQETMQSPPAPTPVIEAKTDAPAESQAKESVLARETPPADTVDNKLADASRQRANTAQPGFEEPQGRRDAAPGRKQENAVAEQTAIGAVAAAPPAAAPALADTMVQKNTRSLAPVEIVSPDPRRRWRVIADTVERSQDSGTSWIAVYIASSETLAGGTAPTGSICWLIGANGVVLVTADGTTFARVPIPERVDLTSVTATDGRSATVRTADGRQFRTDDGGRTWRQN